MVKKSLVVSCWSLVIGIILLISVSSVFSVANAAVVAEANLVSYFSFDDANDSNCIIDLKGHAAGAFVADTNTAAHSVTGKIGKALNFNGTSDYIDTNNTFQSTFRDSFTINLWCKPYDGHNSDDSFFGIRETVSVGEEEYSYYVEAGLECLSEIGLGKIFANYSVISSRILRTNEYFSSGDAPWTMLTFVYENINNTNLQIYIYANTILLANETFTGVNMSLWGEEGIRNFYLAGVNQEGYLFYAMQGYLDEFRIYNKALEANEISLLYYQGMFHYISPSNIKAGVSYSCFDDANGVLLELTGTMPAGSKTKSRQGGRFRIFR